MSDTLLTSGHPMAPWLDGSQPMSRTVKADENLHLICSGGRETCFSPIRNCRSVAILSGSFLQSMELAELSLKAVVDIPMVFSLESW